MAFSSLGTTLKIGNGATTEVFTAVGELRDVKGPTRSLGTEDVTHHGSAAAEFVATVLDNGEVTFDMNYDPADTIHAQIIDDMEDRTLRKFELTYTDDGDAKAAFSAFITKFETDMKVKGALTASITLKISGAVVITP